MIKYIITKECNRKCPYCISRNIHQEETDDLREVNKIFSELSKQYDSIMLTGGEPTLSNLFHAKLMIAFLKFKHIYITTQNPKIFIDKWARLFDAITFSLHDVNIYKFIDVNIFKLKYPNVKVYASILLHQYSANLVYDLKENGWDGLMISEEQRNEMKTDWPLTIPRTSNFSIKRNYIGHCLNDTIILPDLTIINNFKPYL
jgi:organic radical activating enzyme